MADDTRVSIDQAIAAQRALRATLGLGDEQFAMDAFIGMLSDEIEQLRDAGHDDAAIAAMIADAAGAAVDAGDVARHYAHADDREDR